MRIMENGNYYLGFRLQGFRVEAVGFRVDAVGFRLEGVRFYSGGVIPLMFNFLHDLTILYISITPQV